LDHLVNRLVEIVLVRFLVTIAAHVMAATLLIRLVSNHFVAVLGYSLHFFNVDKLHDATVDAFVYVVWVDHVACLLVFLYSIGFLLGSISRARSTVYCLPF
jgi:hypothetical protein